MALKTLNILREYYGDAYGGFHPVYVPCDPRQTILYQVVADHLETFLATVAADPTATGLPAYVVDEFYAYLQCGILAHGFVRLVHLHRSFYAIEAPVIYLSDETTTLYPTLA